MDLLRLLLMLLPTCMKSLSMALNVDSDGDDPGGQLDDPKEEIRLRGLVSRWSSLEEEDEAERACEDQIKSLNRKLEVERVDCRSPIAPPKASFPHTDLLGPHSTRRPLIPCPLGRTPRAYHPTYQCHAVEELTSPHYIFEAPFTGTIFMGTPTQALNVIYDTGSANFWVLSANCLNADKFCTLHKHLYNSDCSSTYIENGTLISLHYGSGIISGHLSQDTLRLGDDVSVPNLLFIEITDDRKNVAGTAHDFDGLMGLAYIGLSKHKIKPVLYSMKDQGLIERRAFSMFVYEDDGQIVWGGSDERFFEPPMQYVNLERQKFFQVTMDMLMIGDAGIVCSDGCSVILDTGSSHIVGPSEEIQRISQYIEAVEEKRKTHSEFMIPCDKVVDLPLITLVFGGQMFSMPAKDYVVEMKDDDGSLLCLSRFMSIDDYVDDFPDVWIIGDLFLKRFYVEYDLDEHRVGFAKRKEL